MTGLNVFLCRRIVTKSFAQRWKLDEKIPALILAFTFLTFFDFVIRRGIGTGCPPDKSDTTLHLIGHDGGAAFNVKQRQSPTFVSHGKNFAIWTPSRATDPVFGTFSRPNLQPKQKHKMLIVIMQDYWRIFVPFANST